MGLCFTIRCSIWDCLPIPSVSSMIDPRPRFDSNQIAFEDVSLGFQDAFFELKKVNLLMVKMYPLANDFLLSSRPSSSPLRIVPIHNRIDILSKITYHGIHLYLCATAAKNPTPSAIIRIALNAKSKANISGKVRENLRSSRCSQAICRAPGSIQWYSQIQVEMWSPGKLETVFRIRSQCKNCIDIHLVFWSFTSFITRAL